MQIHDGILGSWCDRAFPGVGVRLLLQSGLQPCTVDLGRCPLRPGHGDGALSGVHAVRTVQLKESACIFCAVSIALFPSVMYSHYRIIKNKLNWSPLSLFTLCCKYFYHVVLCAGSAVNFSIAAGSFVITLLIMNCCLLAIAACVVMISAGGRVIEGKKIGKNVQATETSGQLMSFSEVE